MNYILIASSLLALVIFILASVALGSANQIEAGKVADKTHVENTQRSNQGLLVISLGLLAIAAWQLYKEYKPKQQSIYYF